jgi:predicted HNH restriction endonuclease
MLADVEGERNVTVEDVKVLCSNCHRIVHSKRKMLDWRLLKEGLQQSD